MLCHCRKILHKVCQELTQENVSDILFLCEHRIARSQRERIKDPHDLLKVLEHLKIVGPENLHFLSNLFVEIRRCDLAKKVNEHSPRRGTSRLEGDDASWVDRGPVTRSVVVSDRWQEDRNHVASYRPARVLQSDNAKPIVSPYQCTSPAEHSDRLDARNILDSNARCSTLTTQDHCSGQEVLPCYIMKRNPRGMHL